MSNSITNLFFRRSRRLRPRQAFAMLTTTARCSNLRTARSEMRCYGSNSSLRRPMRAISHYRDIHGRARTEAKPLPLHLRSHTITVSAVCLQP